jgi:threonine 3-dehydrogenase
MFGLSKVEAGVGGIALTEHPEPQAGPGEIRLKVAAAGICGTDMQIYHWAPRMAQKMQLPRILGHEVSGVIDQIGPDVDGLSIGDHVSLESHIFCGTCDPCRRDRAHLCENTTYPGISIDGAFADYVVVPARIAWRNPVDLPHEIAAMLEPFGIAVHACMAGSGVADSWPD